MLVSAVSTNRHSSHNSTRMVNDGEKNNNTEMAFNSLTLFSKKNNNTKDLSKIYESINEWKLFCHKQIAKGKLDIII